MKGRVIFFTVFIFIGSLLPNSDLHELSKIPTLLQHYQQHRQSANWQLSFSDFLKMHYACSAEQQTAGEHDSLPFKQMGNSAYDYFVSTPVVQHPTDFIEQMPLVLTHHLHTAPSNLFDGSIWQPPQFI
ncbi:hypothetical protein [uncultured Pontibacter sp.]|uniref:hypothetical protein n=1 Tax=uncultured Pontibacter sp. TaxID=453356 RepID=UPI0026143483|nr:hypothetical protein [uncultured Pontibacter sp.]